MHPQTVPLIFSLVSGRIIVRVHHQKALKEGLLRLLDQRYKGIAHGVGQTEILGRIHVAPIKIGNVFYPCSFMVLDSPNMEFLFGLDMLRKHQCIIDLKENLLRVGGGEVSVPFLQEKDIPSHYLDEERYAKQASGSGAPVASSPAAQTDASASASQSSGGGGSNSSQGPNFESKVSRLIELGFERQAVVRALEICNGNEEQAASFLFGG
uniref:UBA domain-containing protein n=1 Tax=Kalanchoe fedtschenkoi TaxID=63787 RepID=A0A7N0U268_KALFE